MKEKMRFMAFMAAAAVSALLPLGEGPTKAWADSGAATLEYLIGTGFLCDLAPSACPNVARAANGDTLEMTGEGTLSIHPKAVTGGGEFTHKDAEGNVLGGGTWTATKLLSFHSYGSGAAQGFPPETEGGKAEIQVHLTPALGGPGFDAILRVTCELGDKIPASAVDGVRLNIQGVLNFNEEVSGFTLFIRPPC